MSLDKKKYSEKKIKIPGEMWTKSSKKLKPKLCPNKQVNTKLL